MTGAVVERYQLLQRQVADLARAAGRTPDSVRFIAASKTHSSESLEPLLQAGLSDLAENTTQEALPKIERLRLFAPTWHFIGHLQSNKAKWIPGRFHWLHALDSAALAQRLERLASAQGVELNALIEVNITGDPKKHGVAADQLDALLESLQAAELRQVKLRGLMTIGPYPATTAQQHQCFARLRHLSETARVNWGLPHFDQLSMGMSDDYPAAIAEGATMIRIGTALFGERDYGAPAEPSY